MMHPSMNDLYHWVDCRAPFDSQADFDNSGFLVGNRNETVQNILFALDITDRVLDEAVQHGANLIITHHPMMFSPVQRMTEDDVEGKLISRMIRNHISLISAHTNLDSAQGGINDTLAALLGLNDVHGDGYLRIGRFAEPVPFSIPQFVSSARPPAILKSLHWLFHPVPAAISGRKPCVLELRPS